MAKEWYAKIDGVQIGPFESADIKKLADTGRLKRSDFLRKGASGQWVSAEKVKGLFDHRPLEKVISPPPSFPPPAEFKRAEVVVAPAVPTHPIPTAAVVMPAAVQVQIQSPPPHNTNPTPDVARIPCPICGELIAATAIKCRHCNEYLDGRPSEAMSYPQQSSMPQQPQIVMMAAPQPQINVNQVVQTSVMHRSPRWSRGTAMILSFLWPGLGQIYKGQLLNGIVWMLVVIVGYIFLILPGLVLHLLCIVGAGMGDEYA